MKPIEPKLPSPILECTLHDFDQSKSLQDLIYKCKNLNIDLSKVFLDSGYESITVVYSKPNPKYQEELKQYNEDLIKFKNELKEYNIKINKKDLIKNKIKALQEELKDIENA